MSQHLPLPSQRADHIVSAVGGLLLVVVAFTVFCVQTTKNDDPQPTYSAQSACRTWDSGTADGELAVTVGSVTAVANDALGVRQAQTYFLTGFDDFNSIVSTLDAKADLARFASKEPELDAEFYRAFRDLSGALDALRASTSDGEALDVARGRIPAYEKALGTVESLCQPHV